MQTTKQRAQTNPSACRRAAFARCYRWAWWPGAFAIAAYLLVEDASSDLTKVVVGGWIAGLGNVIGFYFGVRSAR